MKKGHLTYVGTGKVGYDLIKFWRCQDCQERYPELKGQIRCNGVTIDFCPWCREDSAP